MDLFLTSTDYYDFEPIRKILSYDKIQWDNKDILRVKVDIPLIGQKYGFGDYDPDMFYLMNRHYAKKSIIHLSEFPIHVFVMIEKDKDIKPQSFSDLNNIAWACLYDKYKDAQNHKM